MDEKQIDLSKPLISFRRQSSKGASERHDDRKQINYSRFFVPQLPYFISELKSGPITDPGSVPFQWEHKPGKPKEDAKDEMPVAPKLPPGRYPGSVERKDAGAPKASFSSMRSPSLKEEISDFEKLMRDIKQYPSHSDSDEEYVDARDSLSRTGSFYLNCGMSDISELNDFTENAFQKSSSDVHSNEFMMKRFLPAAKAMATETPMLYSPKRQSSMREKSLLGVQRTVSNGKAELRYGPDFAKKYSYFGMNETVADEDEDETDKESDFDGSSPAVCGLFSMFCIKNPVSIIQNRVPRLKRGSKAASSPTNRALLEKDSDSCDSVVEKTVIVETVRSVGTLSSSSSTEIIPRITNQVNLTDSYVDDDIKTIIDEECETTELRADSSRGKNRALCIDSSHMKQPEIQPAKDADNHVYKPRKYSDCPLPPPLPKSPSDSWLHRALPSSSYSSQKTFARSFVVPATSLQKYDPPLNSSREQLKGIEECDEGQ